ncbi:MAG TPA: AMP-dependent synthetase [Xanthomonadales bacterium]|nr:AMP-dependent synthetase [Xanthomonadales bacterium]
MLAALQQQLIDRARQTPDRVYLCQPIDRRWHQWTWAEAVAEAERVAVALHRLGLRPGDRVGLVSKNCAHWVIADMAMILSGLVSVPVYPTASARTIEQILRHSGAKACFIGKLEHPESQRKGIPEEVVTVAMPYPGATGTYRWDALISESADGFQPHPASEDDLATLLYTSGSTGEPKGAMHSYRNFAFVGSALAKALDIRTGDRVLSYLPLSHCTERAYVEATSFHSEATLYFVESLDTFAADLLHARPTLFGSVPRLWKKFQLGVLDRLPPERLDRLLRIPLVAGLIRRKIKRGLGIDRATWFASGSAPIAPVLLEWWHRVGVTIREGWGMTETFAYGTQLGRQGMPRFGCIGKALPQVELKTGDNDELLIRSPSLMQGYYREPELSERSFVDGFFRTGDRAFIDPDGWVAITGRVKDVFKTSKGKYVAPVPLESLLARNELIEQACVVGERLDQPVALIQLAEHIGIDDDTLRIRLGETLDAVNRQLEPHERIGGAIVIDERWTVDNDLLTPTLKIRRDIIEARYRSLVEARQDRVVRVPAA